jgi:acyl carrier protein
VDIDKKSDTLYILKDLVIKVRKLKITPDEIRDDADLFADCGLDSISVVDFVVRLERILNVRLPEEDLDEAMFQNISTLAHVVETAKRSSDQLEDEMRKFHAQTVAS